MFIHELEKYLIKNIESNEPKIIYFGIGSEFYNSNNKTNFWKSNENQQFPLFLHDFKEEHMDVQIIIILIDINMSCTPYLITEPNKFYSNSWIQDEEYLNIFRSKYKIDVISIKDEINWDEFEKVNITELYNFTRLIIYLSEIISKSDNCLLFYHEFTGKNVHKFENMINNFCYNFNFEKICIDITRGSDFSCYFDLSKPESYPIITYFENKLKYINPNMLKLKQKKKICTKYINYLKKNNKNELNELSDSKIYYDKEFILYRQIIQDNLIILKLLNNTVVPFIRICVIESTLFITRDMSKFIKEFTYLDYIQQNKEISECLLNAKTTFYKIIKYINENDLKKKLEFKIDIKIDENFNQLINCFLENLYETIDLIIFKIGLSFNIKDDLTYQLCWNIRNIKDKYKISSLIQNYCVENNLIKK
jgi:hypothetical protein